MNLAQNHTQSSRRQRSIAAASLLLASLGVCAPTLATTRIEVVAVAPAASPLSDTDQRAIADALTKSRISDSSIDAYCRERSIDGRGFTRRLVDGPSGPIVATDLGRSKNPRAVAEAAICFDSSPAAMAIADVVIRDNIAPALRAGDKLSVKSIVVDRFDLLRLDRLGAPTAATIPGTDPEVIARFNRALAIASRPLRCILIGGPDRGHVLLFNSNELIAIVAYDGGAR